MALVFCDSFDHYTTVSDKWSSSSGGTIGAYGRNSTNGCRLAGVSAFIDFVQKNLTTAHATVTVGAGFRFNYTDIVAGYYTASRTIIDFRDDSTAHVSVRISPIGRLQVINGDGTVLATGTTDIIAGNYYYIEFKATINGTTGAVELKLNAATDASASNVDTLNTATATVNNVRFRSSSESASATTDIDDIYVLDGSGSSNTTFLGDVRVECLFPEGAGALTQWTPSAGQNYQDVDESDPNDDTDYVQTSTATNTDTYTFTDLTPTTGTVKGVQINIVARKDDAGTRTIAPVIRQSSSNQVGSNQNITTNFAHYRQIYDVNPHTSVAFTISEVNADEFGIRLVA